MGEESRLSISKILAVDHHARFLDNSFAALMQAGVLLLYRISGAIED